MITGFSLTATTPDIEEMSVSSDSKINNGLPIQLIIKRSSLEEDQSKVYSDFVDLVFKSKVIEISDFNFNLTIDRISSNEIEEDYDSYNFNDLSPIDKAYIEQFYLLVVELSNQEVK